MRLSRNSDIVPHFSLPKTVGLPLVTKLRELLEPEQMKALCNAPDTSRLAGMMHKALLHTMATTGARVAEIVGMKFADISLSTEDGRIGYIVMVAGKNKAEATPRSIGAGAYNAICEWLDARGKQTDVESEYIFTGFSGRGSRGPRSSHIHTVSAWATVQRYAEAVGLEHVKPHDFRRFVAEQLGTAAGIKVAQTQLGHANIATTAQYMRDKPVLGGTDDLF
jgi:integrase/recombinase XerD